MKRKNKFREKAPVRSNCDLKYGDRKCKDKLKIDFNKRCGYCDSTSFLLENYHVDHFAPQEKFKTHENVNKYSNLIYSCASCNLAKSGYWASNDFNVSVVGDKGFLDPCSNDLNNFFCRNEYGEIIVKQKIAEFIYERLKMYRIIYSVKWMLDRIEQNIDLVESEEAKKDLKAQYYDVIQLLKSEN